MSLGGPSQSKNRIAPPERGSFPLDHAGDCTSLVKEYLACIKSHKGTSAPCKPLARAFLACRMENGLMGPDAFSNLGFASEEDDAKGGEAVMEKKADARRGDQTTPK